MKARKPLPTIVRFYLAYCYYQFALVLALSLIQPERLKLDFLAVSTLTFNGISLIQHHLRARLSYAVAAVLVLIELLTKSYRYSTLLYALFSKGTSIADVAAIFSIRMPAVIVIALLTAGVYRYRKRPLAWIGVNSEPHAKADGR